MKRVISLVWAIGLLAVASLAASSAFADTYDIYDSGNWYINGTSETFVGSLTTNPDSGSGISEALVFQLPISVSSASFYAGGSSAPSALVRFVPDPDKSSVSDIVFYEPTPGDGSLAATGLPSSFGSMTALTPNSDPTVYGSVQIGDNTFVFHDVPSPTPEPTSVIALSSLGGMGLIGLVWRRRK